MLLANSERDIVTLPIGVSTLNLGPDSWLPIGSFQLLTGHTATIRLTQLQLLEINGLANDTCTNGGTNDIVSTTIYGGVCYAALITGSPDTRPLSQPYIDVVTVPADTSTATTTTAPAYNQRDVTAALVISTPGVYTYYIANNTTNRQLLLTCAGTVVIDLGQ